MALPEVIKQTTEDFDPYAWGKLPRELIQDYVKEMIDSTDPSVTFLYVDGCSATPWLREVMRGQYAKRHCLKHVTATIGDIESSFWKRDKDIFAGIESVSQSKLIQMHSDLFSKALPYRRMLEAALFYTLFEPDENLNFESPEALSAHFLNLFQSKPAKKLRVTHENTTDEEKKNTWISVDLDEVSELSIADCIRTIFTENNGVLVKRTPQGKIGVIREGQTFLLPEKADEFMKNLADRFAQALAGKIRRAQFLSLDLATVQDFQEVAPNLFPENILNTDFFRHVLEPERHLVGNIKELNQFGDGTVSVYSMIEGFPYYKDHFNYDGGLQVIDEARRVLQIGGKFIVFPWTTHEDKEMEDLERFTAYMESIGFEVKIVYHNKEELLKNRGERELELTKKSPIFNNLRETLPLLVATKVS